MGWEGEGLSISFQPFSYCIDFITLLFEAVGHPREIGTVGNGNQTLTLAPLRGGSLPLQRCGRGANSLISKTNVLSVPALVANWERGTAPGVAGGGASPVCRSAIGREKIDVVQAKKLFPKRLTAGLPSALSAAKGL
jgi:phage tail tape-measure protein